MSDGPRYWLRSAEEWRAPWDDYRRLRDDDPVHRVDDPVRGTYYVLSRFEDVFDAARDTSTFSSAQGLTPDQGAMAQFEDMAAPIVMMDPPDHTSMRRLVSRPMTPRRVAPFEPEITAFVDDRLDEIAAAGEVDIVASLLKPLPSFVVAHYLGVPDEDRLRFDEWTQAIVAANANDDLASAQDAFLAVFGYANELMERRAVDPGEDIVSDLVAAGQEQASTMWVVGFIFTMITGGNDTTTGLLGGAAELLTAHRDQRRRLLDDPGMIRPAVDEFLRLTSPVQNLARTTTSDVDIGETTIPEGTKVVLLYGSANRDEREFGPDVDELDVGRSLDRILSLGYGAHHCLGAAAARLQAVVALERILDRFPDFEVDADAGRFAPGGFVRRYESLPFRI
ncbi:MAG: cytochrome P450 [Actinomycetota bacterium]